MAKGEKICISVSVDPDFHARVSAFAEKSRWSIAKTTMVALENLLEQDSEHRS